MTFKADLHCHSNCSDGTLSPEELVRLAEEKGLGALSITDHDTVYAYQLLPETTIKILPGAEFSTRLGAESVHILAYSFNPKNPVILDFCERHLERRHERNFEILALLKKRGIIIEPESLQRISKHVIGRPHIAAILIEKGFAKDIRNAFDLFLGEGKCCYSPGPSFTVAETLEVIHEAKGLAFIAHPHLIIRRKVWKSLLTQPFDGLEGYYSKMPLARSLPFINAAKAKNWIVSGGSDFHGASKPRTQLAESWTPEETFEILWAHYQKNL